MRSEADTLRTLALEVTPEDRRETLIGLLTGLDTGGAEWLDTHFASLPRRVGRQLIPTGVHTIGRHTVNLGRYRICDAAAAAMLSGATPSAGDDFLERLYQQGDAEERRMILSALPFCNAGASGSRLLVEAHRSNDEVIFATGLLDSDFPALVLEDEDYANVVLKAAFLDVAPERLYGVASRATVRLSRMLLDFMAEREAAGRPLWPGSLEIACFAPCPGVVSRIAGDLWHGGDRRRLAAARAATVLPRPAIVDSARERVDVEAVPAIRAMLSDLLASP